MTATSGRVVTHGIVKARVGVGLEEASSFLLLPLLSVELALAPVVGVISGAGSRIGTTVMLTWLKGSVRVFLLCKNVGEFFPVKGKGTGISYATKQTNKVCK